MPRPMFKLKLIYPDGEEIPFEAKGKFERDLVDSIQKELISSVREASKEEDFEDQLPNILSAGIERAIFSLKRESVELL